VRFFGGTLILPLALLPEVAELRYRRCYFDDEISQALGEIGLIFNRYHFNIRHGSKKKCMPPLMIQQYSLMLMVPRWFQMAQLCGSARLRFWFMADQVVIIRV
jgi:hypothetical protein